MYQDVPVVKEVVVEKIIIKEVKVHTCCLFAGITHHKNSNSHIDLKVSYLSYNRDLDVLAF